MGETTKFYLPKGIPAFINFGKVEDIIIFNDFVMFSFQIYITDFFASHY